MLMPGPLLRTGAQCDAVVNPEPLRRRTKAVEITRVAADAPLLARPHANPTTGVDDKGRLRARDDVAADGFRGAVLLQADTCGDIRRDPSGAGKVADQAQMRAQGTNLTLPVVGFELQAQWSRQRPPNGGTNTVSQIRSGEDVGRQLHALLVGPLLGTV